MRCIMVEGVNADEKNLRGIAELYARLKNCFGVQLIPCHALGASKNRLLGRTDGAKKEWTPTQAELSRLPGATPRLRRRGDRVGNVRGGEKAFVVDKFPVCPAPRQGSAPPRMYCGVGGKNKERHSCRRAACPLKETRRAFVGSIYPLRRFPPSPWRKRSFFKNFPVFSLEPIGGLSRFYAGKSCATYDFPPSFRDIAFCTRAASSRIFRERRG